MADTRIDFNIHNARPQVYAAGTHIWMNTPVDADKPYQHLVTVHFASPAIAKQVGEQLIAAATTAERIAAIVAEGKALAV